MLSQSFLRKADDNQVAVSGYLDAGRESIGSDGNTYRLVKVENAKGDVIYKNSEEPTSDSDEFNETVFLRKAQLMTQAKIASAQRHFSDTLVSNAISAEEDYNGEDNKMAAEVSADRLAAFMADNNEQHRQRKEMVSDRVSEFTTRGLPRQMAATEVDGLTQVRNSNLAKRRALLAKLTDIIMNKDNDFKITMSFGNGDGFTEDFEVSASNVNTLRPNNY